MNSFDEQVSSPKREVRIVSTAEVEKHTVYTIQVSVEDCQWTVQHRYSEFHELHETLVSQGKVERSLLPPKRLIGNLSKSFVEKRQRDLETYLAKVLQSNHIMPKPLMLFLEFDIYDINGVSQALAAELFAKGDLILASQDVCEMTPMQLFAITERLKMPLPTCDSDDAHSDIGHIMDFMSRLKYLRIVGSTARLGSSSRKVDELPYDLSYFKAIKHLQIDVCNAKLIAGIEEVKRHITFLAVNRTLSSLQDILLPNAGQWEALAGASGQDLMKVVPPWSAVKQADFSHNSLTSIDHSVCLLPHVQQLNLSHNQLRAVDHLQHLPAMTHLNLSYNQLSSLENLNTRLGNVHTLLLTKNDLSSLQGLSKLYSLVKLDIRSNIIEHVVEIQHVCNLPCLEQLLLSENPVTNVVDYRTKVLELFEDRFMELSLDGHKPSEKEKDTVNILKAIKKSKDYRPFVGSKHNSPKKVVHEAAIADPSSSKKGSNISSLPANLTGDDPEFKAKVESLRQQGGKAWLSIFNEMSDPSGSDVDSVAEKKMGQEGRGKKDKSKRARSRSRSPKPKSGPPPDQPRPLQQVKLSPKAFAYHILDEVSRHNQAGITSIPNVFSQLTVYFQGPKLFTYGPRHEAAGMPPPAVNGPTLEKYLNLMTAQEQEELVGVIRGVKSGSVKLASKSPSETEVTEVLSHVLALLGWTDRIEKPAEMSEDSNVESKVDQSESNLDINNSQGSTVEDAKEQASETVDSSELQDTSVDTVAEQLEHTDISVKVSDEKESAEETEDLDSSQTDTTVLDIPSVEFGHEITAPNIKPQVQTHRLPEYEESVMDHLSSCIQRKELVMSPSMQCLAVMSARELVKYFHENVTQIGLTAEYLLHVLWTNVITYACPTEEVISCVMLSTRALYVLSDKNVKFHREAWKTHRRMCSDSAVNKSRLRSGRLEEAPHASGVILNATESMENRVRCQHVMLLSDLEEVVVGLFDQKIRLTGQSAENTMTLITRSFKETHNFQQQLMLALPCPASPREADQRPGSPIDLYQEAMKARQEAVITEYRHPGGVKFTYANEETINDLTYLVVEKVKSLTHNVHDVHLLMYMLLHQIGDVISNSDYEPPVIETTPRYPRSLILTNTHAALCVEDHVCYPIPNFSKLLPDSQQYAVSDVQPIFNLKRLVVSDFSSCDITLIFEVINVEVDISREYFTSDDLQGGERHHTPDVVWTLMLPSLEDRERLMKMLCGQWRDMHNKELSIQVSA
ncbi:nischarin-like [Diadema antillarum]|uniref:nischarin-like n=1 Tax=Diadema antillarum TaxID=105358 RepID=UPI003A88D3D4